jgi:hypothetical protein
MNVATPSSPVLSIDPYLSVVVTTRNDDHGGDPLRRLQAFVNSFDEQCRRTGLDAEVLVVEWNPPSDRPRLHTLLQIPQPRVCTYRFIEVPAELHDTLQYGDVLPLFQMIAKNVGIRRARGRYVLATNIDIIFSNELIDYIASRRLEPGRMYRVDRHDIEADVPVWAPLDELQKYCREHQLRVHTKWGSCTVDANGHATASAEDIVDGVATRLGSGWHVREGEAATGFYRWAMKRATVDVDPVTGAGGALEIDLEPNPYAPSSPLQIEVSESGVVLASPIISRRRVVRLPLDSSDAARTFELSVRSASSDGGRALAVFERRGDMQYIVRSIRVVSPERTVERASFVYPPAGWRVAGAATAEASPNESVWQIASAPRRWGYCLQYGPLRARRTGDYRFVIRADIQEGGVALGVLTGDQRSWLGSSVEHIMTDDGELLSASVGLKAGDRFWLMISNDHPLGDATSRFTVRELTGSAELGTDIVWNARRAPQRVLHGHTAIDSAPAQPKATAPTGESGLDGAESDHEQFLRKPPAQPLLAPPDGDDRATPEPARPAFEFSLDRWRAASSSPSLVVEHAETGVSVVTERRKWSYCLEYGPLAAPVRGIYRFAADCQVLEGGARLGVLSVDRVRWLTREPEAADDFSSRPCSAVAQLRRGQQFWLVLYNDHPQGDQASKLLVGNLSASVDAAATPGRAIRGMLFGGSKRAIPVPDRDAAYPLAQWRLAGSARQKPAISNSRLQAVTSPQKWSYCLEYGPLRVEKRGIYCFTLSYTLGSGGITVGVLDESKKKWLRSSVRETGSADTRAAALSVLLTPGRAFWIVVSNDHPDGEGVSTFEVHSLMSRFEPISWRDSSMTVLNAGWSLLTSRTRSLAGWTMGRPAAIGRAMGASNLPKHMPAGVSRALSTVRRRVVMSAPEYQQAVASCHSLEEQVRTLAPLQEMGRFFKLMQDRRPEALHLNGCGDFQMMAREHWMELRGYPEFQTFSMNIDGVFSSIACYAGIEETVLESPCHIYHIEHEVGSGWSPEGEAVLRRRIAERGITWIDSRDVFVWSAYMHWLQSPMIFNLSHWGMSESQLSEQSVLPTLGVKTHSA